MSSQKRSVTRARDSQMSIRLDSQLYEEYKEFLKRENVTMTDDIESYIKSRLGKKSPSNVIDISRLAQDVEELKIQMGKLKAS
ncbi:hypothetical protein ACE1AT_13205 [Pelatocladus sp. BLCC-F211]|uniref:hypothetical protein n=1 Tax=Pelatocladus sp. BLCC-F211 TaxID=3342752 RepID=UPI0035B82B47